MTNRTSRNTEAVNLLRQGRIAEAERLLHREIKSSARNGEAFNLLAIIATKRGDIKEGIGLMRRAVASAPDVPGYRVNLGMLQLSAGDADGAESTLREAARLAPSEPHVHCALGHVLMKRGRADEARGALERALHLAPELGSAHLDLGRLAQLRGDLRVAADHFRRASAAKPAPQGADLSLARALMKLQRFDEARHAARRAASADPGSAEAFHLLGLCLRELGRLSDSVRAHARAVQLAPNDIGVRLAAGAACLDAGDLAGAEASFRAIVSRDDRHADGWNNLGSVLRVRWRATDDPSHRDEALAAFSRASAIDPRHPRARENLARFLVELGRIDEAKQVLSHWLAADPDNAVARHQMAALGGATPPVRASDDFVRGTFDAFAATFETALADLRYSAPQHLHAALKARHGTGDGETWGRVLDAGCGTGLCGRLLRAHARHLVGVDLSPRMLAQARELAIYDEVAEAEITGFLLCHPQAYDMVVAADVFCYFGDLSDLCLAASGCLRDGGLIGFTVEALDDDAGAHPSGYRLGSSGRYAHAEDHVRKTLDSAGFDDVRSDRAELRLEHGKPVHGLVVTARRRADVSAH